MATGLETSFSFIIRFTDNGLLQARPDCDQAVLHDLLGSHDVMNHVSIGLTIYRTAFTDLTHAVHSRQCKNIFVGSRKRWQTWILNGLQLSA